MPDGWTAETGDLGTPASPKSAASLYVVDVAGDSQVLLVETHDSASAADRAEVQSILDSISFEPEEWTPPRRSAREQR